MGLICIHALQAAYDRENVDPNVFRPMSHPNPYPGRCSISLAVGGGGGGHLICVHVYILCRREQRAARTINTSCWAYDAAWGHRIPTRQLQTISMDPISHAAGDATMYRNNHRCIPKPDIKDIIRSLSPSDAANSTFRTFFSCLVP